MKQLDHQLKQLIRTLPPTQRTLDFDEVNLWQSLPDSDRHACCKAIAALLTQIASVTHEFDETNKHDRTSKTRSAQENEDE